MGNLETKLAKVLFVPDTHRPYHDKRAWSLLLKVGKDFKPDKVVVLGDFGDFYTLSRYLKDPARKIDLQTEVADMNKGLDELDQLTGEKFFISGNHEVRLEDYLKNKAPELFHFFKIEELLKLRKRGWGYIPYRKTLKLGKMNVTHDTKYAGTDAHRRTRSKFAGNVIIGHSHRMSIDYIGNLKGEQHVGGMFGWLGDKRHIDYDHEVGAAEWTLGFGTGYLNTESGLVFIQAHPIINYKTVVNGKLFE